MYQAAKGPDVFLVSGRLLPSYLQREFEAPDTAVWCTMSCRQPAKLPMPNTAALQRGSVAFCCPGLRLNTQLFAPHSGAFCLISQKAVLSLCRLPRALALNPANITRYTHACAKVHSSSTHQRDQVATAPSRLSLVLLGATAAQHS